MNRRDIFAYSQYGYEYYFEVLMCWINRAIFDIAEQQTAKH